MDDFNIISLRESRNEWCMRLINILTPKISEGLKSIFISARKLCMDNNEPEKYLLTFQNLLTRIPQWNSEIIKEETSRIVTTSNCKYLEDLITCVHIIQLKILTYVRVGTKHKKIDLNIPKLNDFIHKIYILIARVIYQKAYLYSLEINTLERQKNNVVVENIIQECIMNAVRDSIPYELIVRSYLDETDEICEDIKEEIIKEKVLSPGIPSKEMDNKPKIYKSTMALVDATTPTSNPPVIPVDGSVSDTIQVPTTVSVVPTTTNTTTINTLPEISIPDMGLKLNTDPVADPTIINSLNTLPNDNLLFDNVLISQPSPPPLPKPQFNSVSTNINKDEPSSSSLLDDMDLTICDLPTQINMGSSNAPALDFIELN